MSCFSIYKNAESYCPFLQPFPGVDEMFAEVHACALRQRVSLFITADCIESEVLYFRQEIGLVSVLKYVFIKIIIPIFEKPGLNYGQATFENRPCPLLPQDFPGPRN